MPIALRRAHQEISSGSGALARVGDGSTGDVASACGEAQYDAPYNAKPSIKNARIDDQGAVFWRSRRVIAGITDGRDVSSASSSLGARVNPSCAVPHLSRKSTRNARLGTLYILVTPFTHLDEFGIRCSRELSADERDLLRSTWESRAADELVQLAAIASLAST
jgi:hypothetical protein